MIPSAVSSAPVQAHACEDGAAEARTSSSKKPRPVNHHRNGANKTVTHLEKEIRSNGHQCSQTEEQRAGNLAEGRAAGRPRRRRQEEGQQVMTAPTLARPALTVVPQPASLVDAVPLAAARIAVAEAFAAAGVTSRPADDATSLHADAVLTLLMQAYGATVSADPATIEHAQWLGSFAGLTPMEVAS